MAKKLGYKIQGIDPCSGLIRVTGDAVKAYGLNDYTLSSASGAGHDGRPCQSRATDGFFI